MLKPYTLGPKAKHRVRPCKGLMPHRGRLLNEAVIQMAPAVASNERELRTAIYKSVKNASTPEEKEDAVLSSLMAIMYLAEALHEIAVKEYGRELSHLESEIVNTILKIQKRG